MRTELQRIITNLLLTAMAGLMLRPLTARILDQLHELQRLKRTAPVVEDKLKCPKCSSEDILTGDPDWAKEFPEVECNSCGECWTPRSANAQKVGNLEMLTVRSIEVPDNPQAISEDDTTLMFDGEISEDGHNKLLAALQPGEAQGADPVAWQWRSKLGPSGWKSSSVSNIDPGAMTNQYEKRPLYATPPAALVTVAGLLVEYDALIADGKYRTANRLLKTEGVAALRALAGEA